jgi:hypothetical protein
MPKTSLTPCFSKDSSSAFAPDILTVVIIHFAPSRLESDWERTVED